MRISDWSSDVCSSDLFLTELAGRVRAACDREIHLVLENDLNAAHRLQRDAGGQPRLYTAQWDDDYHHATHVLLTGEDGGYYADRSEEHTSELQSLMRISYAVFCLKKKNNTRHT